MKLSVIIPCLNEEGNVTAMYNTLSESLKHIKHELIFIDDGSTDNTLNELKSLYKPNGNIKIISFSRNFMKEAAMYAGLKKATGEYTCIIDGDRQQSPDYLLKMVKFLDYNKDYDQVAMVMKKRHTDNFLFKFFKKVFYKVISSLSEIKFVNGASDFRMFRNNVKEAILSIGENNRFSKGIFSWIGFVTEYMEYEVQPRKKGKTKYNFKRSFRYAIDGIVGFSTKPLKLAMIIGIISSFAAFIYVIVILVQTLIYGIDVPGYASTLMVVLLLGGIQLITIGILGEYMAKTYIETKKRPIYISREEIGFDKELY